MRQWRRRDKVTGRLLKSEYGAWVGNVFALLAKMKGLRGSTLDIFGKTAERKMERRLMTEYEQMVSTAAMSLTAENHPVYLELATLPEEIRGFGHVKEESIQRVEEKKTALLAGLKNHREAALTAAD